MHTAKINVMYIFATKFFNALHYTVYEKPLNNLTLQMNKTVKFLHDCLSLSKKNQSKNLHVKISCVPDPETIKC